MTEQRVLPILIDCKLHSTPIASKDNYLVKTTE